MGPKGRSCAHRSWHYMAANTSQRRSGAPGTGRYKEEGPTYPKPWQEYSSAAMCSFQSSTLQSSLLASKPSNLGCLVVATQEGILKVLKNGKVWGECCLPASPPSPSSSGASTSSSTLMPPTLAPRWGKRNGQKGD